MRCHKRVELKRNSSSSGQMPYLFACRTWESPPSNTGQKWFFVHWRGRVVRTCAAIRLVPLPAERAVASASGPWDGRAEARSWV